MHALSTVVRLPQLLRATFVHDAELGFLATRRVERLRIVVTESPLRAPSASLLPRAC